MQLSDHSLSGEMLLSQQRERTGASSMRYRGQLCTPDAASAYPRHIPTPSLPRMLKYRGANCRVEVSYESSTAFSTQMEHGEPSGASQGRPVLNRHRQRLEALATTHRQNLQRNLERRLQLAQGRGDRHLIQLLEQELHQLA